ncbi:MFS transporter [Qipengyuania flava]|uniref:MFS transporter n=1 Tax=Qipengyuania flava TaxID=192812 RepID=UPI00215B18E2|nr:MFS transporter [Qipengyuania flava]
MDADTPEERRQSPRFLWLYALAVAGGAVSYVPFLTLLLPLRASEMAGDATINLLAYTAFCGAIAASLANIIFGWLSDKTRTRKPWIVTGMVLSGVLLHLVPLAKTPLALISTIVCWQFSINMMLAPLAAWAGDVVPDRQKGTLGGLLAFAPALGALSGAFVTIPGLAGPDGRISMVAILVVAMVLPVVLFGRPAPMPHLMEEPPSAEEERRKAKRAAVGRMWVARLLIQIAEAALFAYLLIWLSSLDSEFRDADTARIFAIVLALSVPLALAAGRWSDARRRPMLPLTIGAGIGSVGLVMMALSEGITGAILGYFVFGLSTSVFLALHSSQTLRVLPRPATRGRDLGIFNLTNTVPSLIMPWLALAMVPVFGFAGLFWLFASLAALATILLATMPKTQHTA